MLLKFLLLGNPKRQCKMIKHPLLKENVNDADVWTKEKKNFWQFLDMWWVTPLPPPHGSSQHDRHSEQTVDRQKETSIFEF